MALAKKKKKNKVEPKSIFVFAFCACIVLVLLVGIVQKIGDNNAKQKEMAALNNTLESLVSENEALEEAAKEGDEKKLAEEYARKKGYVMPDERVYVDITPGSEE